MIALFKSLLLVVVVVSFSSLLFSQRALAVNVFPGCGSNAASTTVCKDVNSQTPKSTNPVIGALKTVIDVISLIIGVVAVIMIMVGGLRMILSAGDSKTVASARNSIIYAAVGILVAVVAQGLVVFVIDKVK